MATARLKPQLELKLLEIRGHKLQRLEEAKGQVGIQWYRPARSKQASTSPLSHQEVALLALPADKHLEDLECLQDILPDHPQLVKGVFGVFASPSSLWTVHLFARSAAV